MKLLENHPLSGVTTFHTGGYAKEMIHVENIREIKDLIESDFRGYKRYMVLGGGSNVLFRGDYDGLIVHPALKGIQIIREDRHHIFVSASAGELWDDVVRYCTENNYGGLENLSLIPGTAGASPIQNIGAYGTELSDCFDSLQAIELKTGNLIDFNKNECSFSYRNSIFKQQLQGRFIITNVSFRLEKDPAPKLVYKDLVQESAKMGIPDPGIMQVREMVCDIRRRKLPDPLATGNAGSFFKNPEVSEAVYNDLLIRFPDIVSYKLTKDNYKLAAGWMIDQCGWKGKRFGDAGVHERQALVLVNHGDAAGEQIIDLAGRIMESIRDKFGVILETEVNII